MPRKSGDAAEYRIEVNMSDETTELEAAAFRRLLQHLNTWRTDVQNIDLMILAGFCRNCLADWYREAAEARGMAMSKDEAAKMLQDIRDRDLLRRMQQLRKEQSQRRPVDKDW